MIAIIAAISKNNCIGKNGQIPWSIPEDFKRVRDLTTGNVIIMGKNTWESIPEKFRPLPNRTNVVITRDPDYAPHPNPLPMGEGSRKQGEGIVEVYHSINDAIQAHLGKKIFGFGGAGIYKEMINIAEKLYITHVHREIDDCDVYFPQIDPAAWKESAREDHDGFSFVTYARRPATKRRRAAS